jgi:hypothetical protein
MCRCRIPQRITNSSSVRKKSPTSACRPSTSSTRRTTQRSRLAYRRPTTGVVGAVDVHVAAGAGGEAVVAAGAVAVAARPGDAAAGARRDCNASIDKQLHAVRRLPVAIPHDENMRALSRRVKCFSKRRPPNGRPSQCLAVPVPRTVTIGLIDTALHSPTRPAAVPSATVRRHHNSSNNAGGNSDRQRQHGRPGASK